MLLIILTALVVLVAWLVTQTRCVRYMCELWARIQFSRRLPGPNFFSVLFNASEDSKCIQTSAWNKSINRATFCRCAQVPSNGFAI